MCYTKIVMKKFLRENVGRSIAKAVTFRAVILIADGLIIFAITHRFDVAIGVMFFSNVSSTILYFLHERVWNKIEWGRAHKKII